MKTVKYMKSAKSLGIQLIAITLVGIISISTYLIYSNYQSTIKQLQEDNLKQLEAIAKTTALQLNAPNHHIFTQKAEAGLDKLYKSTEYKAFQKRLAQIKTINKLKSDIYTIFMEDGKFKIGVSSGKQQYFGDTYSSHPKELKDNYKKGGQLAPYKDKHGTWISAFHPIKANDGNVVAIIQVDQKFNDFIMKARKKAFNTFYLSILVIILISCLIVYIISRLIKIDKQKSRQLAENLSLIENQNKKIKDSINYAQNIQHAILPNFKKITNVFSDAFMYYKAKDVVSGDFPWHYSKGDNIYLAAVDCTGHGVPGAMMSFIGFFLLNEINSHSKELSTGEILNELDKKVKTTLRQDEPGSLSKDGMDIALVKINTKTKEMEYSGAHRPLYMVNKAGELTEFKGTRKPIGGQTHPKLIDRMFETFKHQLNEGDRIFFFSDGLPDQIGGPNKLKFGPKRIRELISSNVKSTMSSLNQKLDSEFTSWQTNEDQLDDILLIGIEI